MDLPSICNAPRALVLGGVTYRARTLTLGQLGEVLAWLEDRLPPSDPPAPVLLGGEASQLALAGSDGLAVLLHLALASCHPEMTRDTARSLAEAMDPAAESRLLAIVFHRRPSYEPTGEGRDLAFADWGAIFHSLSLNGMTGIGDATAYPGIAELTLDQLENVQTGGETGGGIRPSGEGKPLSLEEVQRHWQDAQNRKAEAEAAAALEALRGTPTPTEAPPDASTP